MSYLPKTCYFPGEYCGRVNSQREELIKGGISGMVCKSEGDVDYRSFITIQCFELLNRFIDINTHKKSLQNQHLRTVNVVFRDQCHCISYWSQVVPSHRPSG